MKGRKLRPLHLPSPVPVRIDDRGRPVATGGREIVQIREIWRIDDEWWREPLSRLYFEVILENGKRAVLYRDLTDGRWYGQ
ncbi:MAG: hypothetical protein R3223_09060 [Longimicrobiales bacterium]|nr:hypothetical protein [Longimicrobiales bacterium]